MGIAMLGSMGSAAYRGSISDAIPASVLPELADAARSTLAGAVAAAEQLSASPGAELLGAARLAFAQSFELIAVVAAVVVVIAAAFVVIVLREEAPQSETPTDLNLQTAECLASS
jgi:MFS transporter, DHA2 family, multidrug resistance protein